MACFHPMQAWRTETVKKPTLAREPPHALPGQLESLKLPCGKCLGCAMDQSRAWAYRCRLELQQHQTATFATFTYNDEHLPATLQRRALQLLLKRIRATLQRREPDRNVRFFASGEYGEANGRPHYHAILYGLDPRQDRQIIQDTWSCGYTTLYPATHEGIAYVAGYTAKKIGWHTLQKEERIDTTTGEVYTWQPPFIQMSRRPGIAAHARKWVQSWRLYAINNGHRMAVPRYLHEAWKQQATDQQLEELLEEKRQIALTRDTNPERLEAAEKIAVARQAISAGKRKC